MEGDGKAVYFILNTVKEEKLLGLTWQINDSQRIPKEQFIGLVHPEYGEGGKIPRIDVANQ